LSYLGYKDTNRLVINIGLNCDKEQQQNQEHFFGTWHLVGTAYYHSAQDSTADPESDKRTATFRGFFIAEGKGDIVFLVVVVISQVHMICVICSISFFHQGMWMEEDTVLGIFLMPTGPLKPLHFLGR